MIDTYQQQEPINTDAECPVIPVHDYDLWLQVHQEIIDSFNARGREKYLKMYSRKK